MTDLVRTVTLEDLASMLRDKGFRAEKIDWPGGREALASAAGGVGFTLVAGNGGPAGYHDFTYFANFRVEGLDVDALCASWNMGRRFARTHARDGLLNFEMDVTLGTGVSKDYPAMTLELWNQLLNELLAGVRDAAAQNAQTPAPAA